MKTKRISFSHDSVAAFILAARPSHIASHELAANSDSPLPAFHPQQPKRIELSNGMVIFLQEDHELPLIDGTRAHSRRLAQ